MQRHERAGHRIWQAAAALVLVTLATAGCTPTTTTEGPRLRSVPEGFRFAPGQGTSRFFPNRVVLNHDAWFGDIRALEPESDIYITTYEGYATMGEAQAARDVRASQYGDPASIDYAQVTQVSIDGQPAFAWMETRHNEYGAVRSLGYTAFISYDTVTYVVEFSTSARERLHPDSLTRVVHSWGMVETVQYWNRLYGGAAVIAGILLLLMARARRRRQPIEYDLWQPESDPEADTGGPPTPSGDGS